MNLPISKATLPAQLAEVASRGHQVREVRLPEGDQPLVVELILPVTSEELLPLTYWYVTRPEELPSVLSWLATQQVIGLDLETAGLDPRRDRIATLQLGNPRAVGAQAIVIDVRRFDPEQLQSIFDVLESPTVEKLGQNIRFEYKFLRVQYGVRLRRLTDTQVAEQLIRAGLFASAKNTGERAAYGQTSMASLAKRYLGLDIDKDRDLRISFDSVAPGEHSLRQILYAATDVIYPFYIAEQQRLRIEERKLRGIVKIEMAVIPTLGEMEYRGMRMDRAQWRALWQEAVTRRAEAETALDRMIWPATVVLDLFDTAQVKQRPIYPKTGKPLNYSSSEQVKWAIQAYCQHIQWSHEVVVSVPEIYRLKKKFGHEWIVAQQSFGRGDVHPERIPDRLVPEDRYCLLQQGDQTTLTLRQVRGQLPTDLVQLLGEYSRNDIRCGTFGNEFLRKHVREDTGRLHMEVHQLVAATGRLSSQPNTMAIPSDPRYRKCFIPGPGFKYVIADYSQQEPRVLAQASGDPTYRGTYARGDDIYLAVAEAMLGYRPDTTAPEGKLLRQLFKVIVLSMAYRSGANKLRDQLTEKLVEAIASGAMPMPTIEYAKELHAGFFAVHAHISEYQNQCSEAANPHSPTARKIWDEMVGGLVTYVRAPCGRLRFFRSDAMNTYTEGANAPIQGTSATMTKAALCLLQQEIDARGWQDIAWVANVIHDEIVSEVHESIAEEFAQVKQESMERAGRFFTPDVPVVAEFPEGSTGVVDYWTKAVK